MEGEHFRPLQRVHVIEGEVQGAYLSLCPLRTMRIVPLVGVSNVGVCPVGAALRFTVFATSHVEENRRESTEPCCRRRQHLDRIGKKQRGEELSPSS